MKTMHGKIEMKWRLKELREREKAYFLMLLHPLYFCLFEEIGWQ